jgi:hypothetical protein
MRKNKKITDAYCFPGFHPYQNIKGIFGDPKSIIIFIKRTQKKLFVLIAENHQTVITTKKQNVCGIYLAATDRYILNLKYAVLTAGDVKK